MAHLDSATKTVIETGAAPDSPYIPFPYLLDNRSKNNPDGTFAVLVSPPNTPINQSNPLDSLTRISWRDLAYAVQLASHKLNPLTSEGIPSIQGKVVGVIAVVENLAYSAVTMA